MIFLLCGIGAMTAFALRGISSRAAMLVGCLFLLVGVTVTFGAIATTTAAAFLAGTAVAGVGFGPAFLGAFRRTTALATPGQRAGLLAAIFTVAYLAFSVPALIAGAAPRSSGCMPPPWSTPLRSPSWPRPQPGSWCSGPTTSPPGQILHHPS